MTPANPHDSREFAVEVVRRLRQQGFVAYWAGGCVRDRLMGRTPLDYDVATNATPNQVVRLFGPRRTLAIGAAFGVIAIKAPPGATQVEVATFRSESGYSDGRRPDAVTFSSPEEDAQRRDFTINGLFFDPLDERVIDYVGGEADLERRLVRAIGDPKERFQEDKLRLMRAVRFAATLAFGLDEETLAAVVAMAPQIHVVSAERIAQEMRRMLVSPRRRAALEMLERAALLVEVLPEAATLNPSESSAGDAGSKWRSTLQTLDALSAPAFAVSLAALLLRIEWPERDSRADIPPNDRVIQSAAVGVEAVCRRWKLSNDQTDHAVWLVRNLQTLRQACDKPWPVVQRILAHQHAESLISLVEAVAGADGDDPRHAAFCRQTLARPRIAWDPPALVSGHDLLDRGVPQNAGFRRLLDAVRDAQLMGRITAKDEALALVDELRASAPS